MKSDLDGVRSNLVNFPQNVNRKQQTSSRNEENLYFNNSGGGIQTKASVEIFRENDYVLQMEDYQILNYIPTQ